MDTRIISINLTLEETDVVLNALEEKALSINALRKFIFDSASAQVEMMNESKKVEETKDENNKKKGKK